MADAIVKRGGGHVRTHGIGRLQYFWPASDADGNPIPLLKHQVFSSLANTPVQGCSAEIFKLVLLQLTEKLPQAMTVNIVHDELLLEVCKAEAELAKVEVERIMIECTRQIFPGAPMKAEITIANTWAEK